MGKWQVDSAKSHKLTPKSTDRMKASSFRLDASTLERLDRVAAAYAALSLPVSRGAILRQAVELGLVAVEAKLQALAKLK
jgi:predicted transcriptional regulator